MRLRMPTMDDEGLQATPSAHYGSAPFFTFADTDTGEVEAQWKAYHCLSFGRHRISRRTISSGQRGCQAPGVGARSGPDTSGVG
jgi:hypothetical protein